MNDPDTARVVEAINLAFNQKDIDALAGLVDDDIEVIPDPEGPLGGQVIKGRDEFRKYCERALDGWASFRQAPLGYAAAGQGKAVLLMRFKGMAVGGVEFDQPSAQFWTVKDGKGVRSESFSGPRAWTRALGAARLKGEVADAVIRSASR